MIRVCDAIPGAGKTSAAIRYMNENSDKKFIFITPYIEQADRIKEACPSMHFARPRNDLPEYKFRIRNHTAALIDDGRNISTTHEAFRSYTPEMLAGINENGYTLIIDESFDTLTECDLMPGDIEMLARANAIEADDTIQGVYHLGSHEYKGRMYRDVIDVMKSRELAVGLDDDKKFTTLFWMIPASLILAFKDTIIMTYMFEGQDLYHMLKMEGLSYENLYVNSDGGNYQFSDSPCPMPEYARHLREKVHILDNEKLNEVGNRKTSLSKKWFYRSEKVQQLKNNLVNYFNNIHKDDGFEKRMWSTFCKAPYNKIKGRGYTKAFLSFNARARNDMADKTVLAYAVNVYMNVAKRNYLLSRGVEVDQDAYALSTMVQWIWRSAIRNGEDINIYIPSRRMRTLLINWMDSLAEGGDSSACQPV